MWICRFKYLNTMGYDKLNVIVDLFMTETGQSAFLFVHYSLKSLVILCSRLILTTNKGHRRI